MIQARDAIAFLYASAAEGAAALAVRPLTDLDLGLAEDSDPSLAWCIARATFAVGPPGGAPDLPAVERAVEAALAYVRAKRKRWLRLGDSSWTRLNVVGLAPVVAGDPEGPQNDRAILLPDPPAWHHYEPGPPGENHHVLVLAGIHRGRVPWTALPLVRQLVSTDHDETEASGFVAEDLAVAGPHERTPDASRSGGA